MRGSDSIAAKSAPALNEEGNSARSSAQSLGAGEADLPPPKPLTMADQAGLWGAIAIKRAELAERYSQLGIKPTYDPTNRFSVTADAAGNITPNLPDDLLYKSALDKSQGDVKAAFEVVETAHEEEYYHTIDLLQQRLDWKQQQRSAPNLTFTDYIKFQNQQLATEIAEHVGKLPPADRAEAIQDMANILRHYSNVKYGELADTKLWEQMQSDPETRKDFATEIVRELAHYANEKANSETSYLKTVDPKQYRARSAFYDQKVFQAELNEFGPRLKDRLRRVAAGAKAGNPLVP